MKRAALLLLVLSTLGCPAADEAGKDQASHTLQTGQRYRFAQASALDTEQVFEVIAVTPDVVLYRVQTLNQGVAVQEPKSPLVLRFPRRSGGDAEGEQVRLELAERSFTCRVSKVEGLEIYTHQDGGHPAFPGVVKIVQGEEVCYQLVAIETPQ